MLGHERDGERSGPTSIVVWNVEWAGPRSVKGIELARRIAAESPDIVCLTETWLGFALPAGHVVTSEPDYGYGSAADKRKVLLWSRNPWHDVSYGIGLQSVGGRFIRAKTDTPCGRLDVWGVCIPWRDAHVRTGRRDRSPWADHLTYLAAVSEMQPSTDARSRIVVGDFNQQIPAQSGLPQHAAALTAALGTLTVATAGMKRASGKGVIDHCAHSSDLRVSNVRVLAAKHNDRELSDHDGIAMRIASEGAC
jgi:endonuclease/exonuclease/phosphatase family metal-dependent hydrolase